MTPLRNKLQVSPATAIAVLALVVALFGTVLQPVASAAIGRIKGNDIAKNAITSPKVKNHSLRAKDFGPGLLPKAYWSDSPGNTPLGTSSAAPLVVESLNLPKGRYTVLGTTALTNTSGASRSAYCALNAGGEDLAVTRALDIADQRSTDATVSAVVRLTSANTVEFRCYASGGLVYTPAGSRPSITAVAVSALNKQ